MSAYEDVLYEVNGGVAVVSPVEQQGVVGGGRESHGWSPSVSNPTNDAAT